MSHKPWHQPTQPPDTPRQSFLSCVRKYRWTTVDDANKERDRLAIEQPAPIGYHYNVYHCAFCRGYHCGKAPDERQSA